MPSPKSSKLGRLAVVLVLVHAAVAQPGETAHFELASVKLNKARSGSPNCTGGPGAGSLWICPAATMDFLIRSAFALDLYQYPGNSNSFGGLVDSYTVRQARFLPEGATKEQLFMRCSAIY